MEKRPVGKQPGRVRSCFLMCKWSALKQSSLIHKLEPEKGEYILMEKKILRLYLLKCCIMYQEEGQAQVVLAFLK